MYGYNVEIILIIKEYPYASLNRMLFWTERSAASWHAPGIFVLYVYLAVFYRAPRDRDLNSIPKWCDTPMARGLRLQRGTIGNRSEASRWNFVETSWQLRSEWSRMWKPLKFWTLEVCLLCSTRVLRVTRLSRRARHTLFCGCFCRISPNFPVFGKKWLGTTRFRGGDGILQIIKNIDLWAAYVLCLCS